MDRKCPLEAREPVPVSCGMNVQPLFNRPLVMILSGIVAAVTLSGCQTNVGGQTLPSANYLRDDIQYYTPGPEFLLPNTVRAMEEYKASQAGLEAELNKTSAQPAYNP